MTTRYLFLTLLTSSALTTAGGAGGMEAMFAQMHSNAASTRGANPGMNGMQAMMQSIMQWNTSGRHEAGF